MLGRTALVALLLGSRLLAQDELLTIRGVVVDSVGQPIPGVTLKQKGARDALTDDAGQFRIAVRKDAKIALDIRRVGLWAGTFIAKAPPDTVLRLVMFARPQVLPPTVVAARRKQVLERRGFYERQRNGAINGSFLTPEDLEKRRPRSVTGAVEGVPGVRIDVATVGTDSPMVTGTNGCVMTIYLDGIRLTPDSANTVRQRARYAIRQRQGLVVPDGQKAIQHPQNVQIDQLLDIKSVLAIEVYPRALQAPPEYVPPRNDCGVVMLWTTGPER